MRKKFVVLVGAIVFAVCLMGSSASAAPPAVVSVGAAAPTCVHRYSPADAHVLFCWERGYLLDENGQPVLVYRVTGTVYDRSFGQIEWKTATGKGVWQSEARPSFGAYFTLPMSMKYRACDYRGCGEFT